ncbi:coiled-coil domain-containing protein 30 isoform X1 [Poecilia latipinna]|uniref:coiled-coil domain-containing protein 30 isoform X1 n=1 Tax=Poecilia latipinna TaxID=48699 RepID=UPI00072DDA36|nr:PREDICTED: coiled-coil domain-containing protein 30-like isoform X1 [Poecilia latipinna]XP_014908427.1 PREDICTED: coiled-coil domain-containing protein 30-like isoform X1 [Poecilia latipinna]
MASPKSTLMDHGEFLTELDQITKRLQDDGVPPEAGAAERQQHLWRQLLDAEAKLQSVSKELQTLRTQQANEMKEVESYVAHIRALLEECECLTAEYERDNEDLRHKLHQVKHQQEIQSKEMAEMLSQEDLGEIGLSSPSEQVAYLLVERATLLERLEAAEGKLESHTLAVTDSDHQEHIQIMGESLRQQREDLSKTVDHMTKRMHRTVRSPCGHWLFVLSAVFVPESVEEAVWPAQAQSEEISRERTERQRLERDLEEASRRLAMAHQDIRRLNNELDAAKNNNQDPCGSELEGTVQEVEYLRKEVDKMKHNDMMKLQRAKEQNDRLDAENRALRERLHVIESEKKNLMDQMTKPNTEKEDLENKGTESENCLSAVSTQEKDPIHKRCQEAVEDGLVQVRELQRQLQRLRKEQEELEERNEELEALLGEAQNASKEERHRHEGEVEGLHRRVRNLEAELRKHDAQEKAPRNGDEAKATESYLHVHLRDSSQERMSLLEARLTEEKEWRKQLELDLTAAQAALKKDKEALQIGERELKKLRLEVSGLQTECQQGKTLIKSLTQVKGEKAVLEEKVAQMERAHSRLQSQLERHKDSNQTQTTTMENRLQADQTQKQVDSLHVEFSSLQSSHDSLREEMTSERQKTAELQAELSGAVHLKLEAEGKRERVELEVQRLHKQLQWHQEQLTSAKEALRRSQKAEMDTANAGSGPESVEKVKVGGLDQLSSLKKEMSVLEDKLEEERQLASQHQMALQAQISEAQAHIKLQDSLLSQKAEEAKQMKQDVQRAQSLFTSAEKELRYEKEKSLDLKRHNTLLEQENLKLGAELKQAQSKLAQVEQKLQTRDAECERLQQKVRELELQLIRSSTNGSAAASLQEELQAERARLVAAEKKVLELQQQLKNAQHQLRVEEARAGESSRLERESRDLFDSLSALRAQLQEGHIARKLLEQREEELQQQVRSLRLKEASLNRTNTELSHRVQQLDTQLSILDAELKKTREEVKTSQKSNHKLQEELITSQQECERLQEELQRVLLQLDAHIRKYNEKQSQHKTKLCQAKQIFLKATAQRDSTIQKLENDLALASSLSYKEKERINVVMLENEKLLEEKRELLRRISEAEDMGSKGMRTASTVQHRANVLEVENKQLQDRTMKLSNQVRSLERALRNVESFYSMENAKRALSSDDFTEGVLHSSALSLTSGPCDHVDIVDAIRRATVSKHAVLDGTRTSVSTQQPSEQGYLNLTSPMVTPASTKGREETSDDKDQG